MLICAPDVPLGPDGRTESSGTRPSGCPSALPAGLTFGLTSPPVPGIRAVCAHGAVVLPGREAADVAVAAGGWLTM